MTTPDDPPFLDEELRRLMAQFQTDIQPLEELRHTLDAVRGRGEAANGQVKAEVLPSGALAGLHINPRAMRLGADALAEAVMAAANMAATDLAEQLSGMMTDGLTPYADEVRRFNQE